VGPRADTEKIKYLSQIRFRAPDNTARSESINLLRCSGEFYSHTVFTVSFHFFQQTATIALYSTHLLSFLTEPNCDMCGIPEK